MKYASICLVIMAALIIVKPGYCSPPEYTRINGLGVDPSVEAINILETTDSSITQTCGAEPNNYTATTQEHTTTEASYQYNDLLSIWSGNSLYRVHDFFFKFEINSASSGGCGSGDGYQYHFDELSNEQFAYFPVRLWNYSCSSGSGTNRNLTSFTKYAFNVACDGRRKVKRYDISASIPDIYLLDDSCIPVTVDRNAEAGKLTVNGQAANVDLINNQVSWSLPANEACRDEKTFEFGYNDSNYHVNADIYQISAELCQNIVGFTGDSGTINPAAGGQIKFNINVPGKWTLNVAGQMFSGDATVNAVTWNGKDGNNQIVTEGDYKAVLNYYDDEYPKCNDSQDIPIHIKRSTEDCQLHATFGSSVSVSSGNLSDSRQLFVLKGGAIPTDLSLFYNSIESPKSPIDPAINLIYRKKLVDNGAGGVDFDDNGEINTFTLTSGVYVAPVGSALALSKNPDGTYLLTRGDSYVDAFNADGTIASEENLTLKYTVNYAAGKVASITRWKNSITNVGGTWEVIDTLIVSSSLAYTMATPYQTSLGTGFSHSYEGALQDQGNNSYLFILADLRRLYVASGNGYVAQNGDGSILVKNPDGTYTVREKNGFQYLFDSLGRWTAEIDRNNNRLDLVYDDMSLAGVTDSLGRTTTFTYNTDKKLTTITDPTGNAYTFTYDGGTIVTVANPDNSQWSYGYDADSFLTSKTDPNGYTTSYTYDVQHRIMSSRDPEGQVRQMNYNFTTWSTLTEKDGGEWIYIYDDKTGRLREKYDPLYNPTSFSYDERGNMLTKSEPSLGVTTYTYDGNDNVTSVTNQLQETTSYTYNSFGQILTTTSPKGTATNTYDGHGNLTTFTDFDGAVTRYEYDDKGNLLRLINANEQVITFTYNINGYLESVTDPLGAVTSYAYDANGNMISQTTADGKTTTFAYDTVNRLITITDPLSHTTSYAYDGTGNRIVETDANSTTTTYQYNYRNQVTEAKDAQGSAIAYTYGATGCPSCGGGVDKLTSLTDPKGQKTSYQYDLMGNLTQEIDPFYKMTQYTYHPFGKIKSRTDANGNTVTYTYDVLGRFYYTTTPNNAGSTFNYDDRGYVTFAGNRTINYFYTYDPVGRVTQIQDDRNYTINHTYDAVGNRTSTTFANVGITLTYRYDNANRIIGIDTDNGTIAIGYDTVGRRTSVTYPNNVVSTYTYDAAGRLTSLVHGVPGAQTPIDSFTYTHDQASNRLSKTSTTSETYGYDVVYRLTSVVAPKVETFSYDIVGNRQTGPGVKDTAYRYNQGNQMLRGRKLDYEYDNNGNQVKRTVPDAPDKAWNLTWDHENRLAKIERTNGNRQKIITYGYDAYGQRVSQQIDSTTNGTTTNQRYDYIRDGDRILAEFYQVGNRGYTTVYVDGPGIDDHLAMWRDGQWYYYMADGLGSITTITDAQAQPVVRHSYDSYGMVESQGTFRNSYAYTGREWDKEAGLYYYNARYYDPIDGRFISRDPISYKGGINVFAYTGDNPVNRTDPNGLDYKVIGTRMGVPMVMDTKTGQVTVGFPNNYNDPLQSVGKDFIEKNKDTVKDVCKNVAEEAATRAAVDKSPAALKPFIKWGSGIISIIIDVLEPTKAY